MHMTDSAGQIKNCNTLPMIHSMIKMVEILLIFKQCKLIMSGTGCVWMCVKFKGSGDMNL
jgi:hypothetical protein